MEAFGPEGNAQRPLIERAIAMEDIRALGLGPPITVRRDATLQAAVETLQPAFLHPGDMFLIQPHAAPEERGDGWLR